MELYKALKAFSDLMNGCEAMHCAAILEAGSAPLLEKPNMKLVDFCRQLEKISIQERKDRGPQIGQYLEILDRMRPIFDIVTKPAIKGDVEILISTLRSHEAVTIEDFTSAAKAVFAATEKNARSSRKPKGTSEPKRLPKSDLEIIALARRLESALGTREFSAIYDEVKEKGHLSAAEAKELCRKFAGKLAKNATDALKFIWQRHQSLLDSDAMGEATKGHIAA